MGLLDASAPQLAQSHASFGEQATTFIGLLHQQEQTATQALAVNEGSNSAAYQSTVAQMYEAGQKLQALLHTAGTNIGEANNTYLTQDGQAANDVMSVGGMIPTSMPNLTA